MKKLLLALFMLFALVVPKISYADYNDSVRKYAIKYGISMQEARKRLDKEINDALKFYATETTKERTAIKGVNPSVYVPYDIISYINSAQDSFINKKNQKVYVFLNSPDAFFENMGKELFGTSFYNINEALFSLHIEKKEYLAQYNSNQIILGYILYDNKTDEPLVFSFFFKYKKAKDGGYYVMCEEVLVEFADGSKLRNEEALKNFKPKY